MMNWQILLDSENWRKKFHFFRSLNITQLFFIENLVFLWKIILSTYSSVITSPFNRLYRSGWSVANSIQYCWWWWLHGSNSNSSNHFLLNIPQQLVYFLHKFFSHSSVSSKDVQQFIENCSQINISSSNTLLSYQISMEIKIMKKKFIFIPEDLILRYHFQFCLFGQNHKISYRKNEFKIIIFFNIIVQPNVKKKDTRKVFFFNVHSTTVRALLFRKSSQQNNRWFSCLYTVFVAYNRW